LPPSTRTDAAAPWKILNENYHECPEHTIPPRDVQRSPPHSGDNARIRCLGIGGWTGSEGRCRQRCRSKGTARVPLRGLAGDALGPGIYVGDLPARPAQHDRTSDDHVWCSGPPDRTVIECSWAFAPEATRQWIRPVVCRGLLGISPPADWARAIVRAARIGSPSQRQGRCLTMRKGAGVRLRDNGGARLLGEAGRGGPTRPCVRLTRVNAAAVRKVYVVFTVKVGRASPRGARSRQLTWRRRVGRILGTARRAARHR